MLVRFGFIIIITFSTINCNPVKDFTDDDLIVTTKYGKVQGYTEQSALGNDYYAFYEIPFATPPIGKNRFQVPKEPDNWTNVLNATNITKVCVQGTRGNMQGTEDCLYLNIYTPLRPGSTNKQLPVLAYIYGGAFQQGSTVSNGPKYYMDYDVIVVTLNYRVNIFGFLTTEDGIIPGNLGLRDQQFALKWISTNIEAFGGDPTKVTINGVSAGSSSVSYQMIGNGNVGLFWAAIMESGSALAAHEFQTNASTNAFAVGHQLKITTNNSTELLQALQEHNTTDIFQAGQAVTNAEEEPEVLLYDNTIWLPVLESVNIKDAFITKPMHEAFMTGNFNIVPALAGFNSEESLAFLNIQTATTKAKRADDNLNKVIDRRLNVNVNNKTRAGTELRAQYTNGLFQDNVGSFMKYLTDKQYANPTIRQAKCASKYSTVYLYEFGYLFNGKGSSNIPGTEGGVQHAEETIYFWDISPDLFARFTENDKITQRRLLTLWTNFMKYLNPTPSNRTDDLPSWPKVSEDNLVYLNINETLEVKVNPRNYLNVEAVLQKYIEPPYILF